MGKVLASDVKYLRFGINWKSRSTTHTCVWFALAYYYAEKFIFNFLQSFSAHFH
jgi:hypothetical protein